MKKIKQNQIQYFQQQHAAHDRHLFLDKDSRSLIEHFSRLRHLVSERSVLTQSKNLNLELVCSTFFRRKPCDSPSSDSRFDSHCFFSFLFFVSFGSCDRSTSFTVRTQQENWKIANQQRIVYIHQSVECESFERQDARSRQSIGSINAFLDCGHSVFSNQFSFEFIVCDTITTNRNEHQFVFREFNLNF